MSATDFVLGGVLAATAITYHVQQDCSKLGAVSFFPLDLQVECKIIDSEYDIQEKNDTSKE